MRYFVWINGLRGPEPQLWVREPVDGNGKLVKSVLFKTKLTILEECLSINYLVVRYEKDKPR